MNCYYDVDGSLNINNLSVKVPYDTHRLHRFHLYLGLNNNME